MIGNMNENYFIQRKTFGSNLAFQFADQSAFVWRRFQLKPVFCLAKCKIRWFDQSNNAGAIDVKMDGAVPNHLLRCWHWLSLLNCGNSYIISTAKSTSKKIGALILSLSTFSFSTTWTCMEYCCHVWAVTLICYLELLHKLKKCICWTVVPSLAASLETLVHCWNVASLSFFYRYYFGRCSSELAQLVPRILQACLSQQVVVHITNIIANLSPVLYRHSSLSTMSMGLVEKGKVVFLYMYQT